MLYVLGKIGLPERMVAPWQIAEVRDKTGQAYRQMMAWVDSVAGIRERLDREDAVKRLVCQMLEEVPKSRVRAERAFGLDADKVEEYLWELEQRGQIGGDG